MRSDQRSAVMDLVRRADPLAGASSTGWAWSEHADAVLRRIVTSELRDVPPARLRRRGRLVVLVAAIVLAGGAAAAAGSLLGRPAPPAVKQDLRGVDEGMPPDLRLNPDVEDARLAAVSSDASLYYATLDDGGYCFEIVTEADGPRGAICTPGGSETGRAIHLAVPFSDPLTVRSPIVVGGRVNVAASGLEARFDDGSTSLVPLGAEGFFVFDVPDGAVRSAHLVGFDLVALDASGEDVGSARVPPTDFRDPRQTDRLMPIFVSTVSDDADLTKVLGIEGSVNVDGAVRLELTYPDRTTERVPIADDGRYHVDIPKGRQGDFATVPGTLTAYGRGGDVLATATVGSVAFWRGTDQG